MRAGVPARTALGERGTHRQHRLTERDDEEQPETLEQVTAGDLRVPEVDLPAATGQPVQRPNADVGHRNGEPPKREASVAGGLRADHPQHPGDQLPDNVVDEVLAESLAAQGHDENAARPTCRSK